MRAFSEKHLDQFLDFSLQRGCSLDWRSMVGQMSEVLQETLEEKCFLCVSQICLFLTCLTMMTSLLCFSEVSKFLSKTLFSPCLCRLNIIDLCFSACYLYIISLIFYVFPCRFEDLFFIHLLKYSEWLTDAITLLYVILYHILVANIHMVHSYQELWCFQGCHLIFFSYKHTTYFLLSWMRSVLTSSRW